MDNATTDMPGFNSTTLTWSVTNTVNKSNSVTGLTNSDASIFETTNSTASILETTNSTWTVLEVNGTVSTTATAFGTTLVSTTRRISEEETEIYLQHIEQQYRIIMTPAIFFAGLIVPFSVFGNIMILLVYLKRFKQSATRSFILSVAVFDLMCTSIALPMEIFSMMHRVTYPYTALCKLYIFIEQFSATASAATLLAVAFHRYRKICCPFRKQLTVRIAQSLRFCVCIFAVGITWPALILFGMKHVHVLFRDVVITGITCHIQDIFVTSKITVAYRTMFLAIFVSGGLAIAILYIFVVRKVMLLQRCKCKAAQPYANVMREMVRVVRSLSENSESWSPQRFSASSLRTAQKKNRQRPKRTTLMLAITTLVIFVSFLPNLILRVTEQFNENFVSNMDETSLKIYHVFLRSYYLHCAANPIIYGILNLKFRQELWRLVCGRRRKLKF